MKLNLQRISLYILLYILFCSCQQKDNQSFIPKIEKGIARVSGKLINFPKKGDSLSTLSIVIAYPVSAKLKTYTIPMTADNCFFFEIPLECNMIANIGIGGGVSPCICLVPNEETSIELTYIDEKQIKVTMNSSLGLTNTDMENLTSASFDLMSGKNMNQDIYDLSPKEFCKQSVENLDSVEHCINQIPFLSDKAKCVLAHAYKLNMINGFIKHAATFEGFDKSNFSFLKSIDLNDPFYLYGFYHEITEFILSNEKFGISPIGDTPVNDWQKGVKAILVDLIDPDAGLFYDMLTACVYSQQFNDKSKPLSDKQIGNIKEYFKNQSFVDILLAENEKIAQIAGITSHLKINETPSVPEEELTALQKNKLPQGRLVDAIVSKYRGNVVVVDFWATWCGPCIQGIQESRELKAEVLDKEIVFVYITNRSSPKELWEKKIQGIGGEHYYLNDEEWESLSFSEKYGFDGIPTYLIFDKSGVLKHKITAYPGNEKMREIIEELL